MVPRTGCRQRTSASAPQTSRVRASNTVLKMQFELLARQRFPQIALKNMARLRLVIHFLFEKTITIAAFGLDPIKREVRMFEQFVGRVAVVRRQRNADAGRR